MDVFTSRPEVCPPCLGFSFFLPGLLEVRRPVRLLELGIQLPEVAGEVVDPLLEGVHVDGADELDLVAGVAVAADVRGVQGGAEGGDVHGQGVLLRDDFRQGLPFPDGLLVGAVDADDEVLELLQGAAELLEEVLRHLRGLVALLDLDVVGETFPQLGDPLLQVGPLVQCFCQFHKLVG